MLRVCLDDAEVFQLAFRACEDLARGSVPETITKVFMAAMMKALKKPSGVVRGIATGTSFRRLVAKTLARQFGKVVEATRVQRQCWHWSVRQCPSERSRCRCHVSGDCFLLSVLHTLAQQVTPGTMQKAFNTKSTRQKEESTGIF